MIFDEVYGLPKVQGASDFQDSSHLAGILAILDHPQAVSCASYVDEDLYVRCPFETQYDFSRDQAILLMAGLLAQGWNDFVRLEYITGKDLLPPSVRGLEAIAKHGKASWLSHWWLKREITWHWFAQPLEEPFQLVALCISYDRAHGTKYLKLWVESNKLWKWSIRRYLAELDGAWRNEKELCEFCIKRIEEIIAVKDHPEWHMPSQE